MRLLEEKEMTEDGSRKNETNTTKNKYDPQEGKAAEDTRSHQGKEQQQSIQKGIQQKGQLMNPYLTYMKKNQTEGQ